MTLSTGGASIRRDQTDPDNKLSVCKISHDFISAIIVKQDIDPRPSGRICALPSAADPQSFGRNCEYLLPVGKSLTDTANAKFGMSSGKVMYEGDIVCYTTVQCDFGLLCLDWRDICDGVQQCMSGVDEENCDKLEFNECEKDEYRCMNGMCIPDEYFLDEEYDCMDMSDEKATFNDTSCAFQSASRECDDRVCPPNQWSCGDGQCVVDRSVMWATTPRLTLTLTLKSMEVLVPSCIEISAPLLG